jgi:hypothetical protein
MQQPMQEHSEEMAQGPGYGARVGHPVSSCNHARCYNSSEGEQGINKL